jgi:hypothetical protein
MLPEIGNFPIPKLAQTFAIMIFYNLYIGWQYVKDLKKAQHTPELTREDLGN